VLLPPDTDRRAVFVLPPGIELHLAPSGLVLSREDGALVLSDSRGGYWGRVPAAQTTENRPQGVYDLELVRTLDEQPVLGLVSAGDGQNSRVRIAVPVSAPSDVEVAVRPAPGTSTAPVMPGVVVFDEP
jgi:hypothetical protein